MSRPSIPADCLQPVPTEELAVVSADGTRLHVEVHGQPGAPTVVLAHGWTCSTDFWAPVIHRLSDRYRLVAYDQRGHGRSEIPPSRVRYSTRALAEDLSAVLTRVVPQGERAVLVGHSMGGMTVMAGSARPEVAERTAAAVLVSTGPSDLVDELRVVPGAVRSPGVRRFLHRQILRSRLPLGPVGPVTRAGLGYGIMGAGAPAARVDVAVRMVHACPAGVRANWARVLERLDVRAGLARLVAPTSVVVGSEDRLTPPVHAHRMVAALADPQGLLLLPGVGHMAPIERPAETAAEIDRMATAHLPGARPGGGESAADSGAGPGSGSESTIDPEATTDPERTAVA
ncbi:alpha/beta fold hydrolase [Kitasatospora sp. NPDC057692]|uniref:alpha/beta fold hydrolase n=1 Tax=Kitasatospora sp. NPDC057692 TaxID=3346215 RepID=UPI0036952440